MRLFLKIMPIIFLFGIYLSTETKPYKVGLLVVATGRYIEFVIPLIESARKHFCSNQEVTYFIFTDSKVDLGSDVMILPHARLGWPYDTLMRCQVYAQYKERWKDMDYLFACDADMLFCADVGDEILSDLVATRHPGFLGRRGTYETSDSKSAAYVADGEGTYYFAGGFHGGSRIHFTHLITTMLEGITQDLTRNFIAVWHDESYLNRYFIDYKPTLILSSSYCCPGNAQVPYERKLVALEKNHQEYRA